MTLHLKSALLLVLAVSMPAVSADTDAGRRSEAYVLGANDRITVRCLNVEEFPQTPIRIDSDGQVTLPFIGRIKLAGSTVSEAERDVEAALSKYVREPLVSVNVAESHSQPVSVYGAVNNPGIYQLEGDKSLSEVLSMAGGLRKDAGLRLKVTRDTKWGPLPLPSVTKDTTGQFNVADVEIDGLIRGTNPAANIEMKAYDVISVPQAELVYVVGQVKKPGGFTMTGRDGLTVLQALAMAEGLDHTSAPKKARILRKSGDSGPHEVPVNLDAILSGTSRDVVLQADDILFVPNNTAKSAGMKTLDTMIQLTTGIVIYGKY
jgi:polysaccharide export outer membrane protein